MSERLSKAGKTEGGIRSSESDSGPYRTPAAIAADMPRTRRPFPWKAVRACAFFVGVVQAPLAAGALHDVAKHGTRWEGTCWGGGVLALAIGFACLPCFLHSIGVRP